ncbi:hypothetical protein PYCC9005_000534 [Savitreella phatthalungensis]
MSSPTLLVMGGAGFLGSHICRSALTKGWRVIAVNRGGRPNGEGSSFKGTDNQAQEWTEQVEWLKGDALRPDSFAEALQRVDHIAHTIGVLDYRGFLSESRPSRAIDKLGSTIVDAVQEAVPYISGQTSPELQIYDKLNHEAAVSVIDAARQTPNVKSILYISAAAGFPGIPQRYITSKRRAEEHLLGQIKPRPIVFRPGFMYSDSAGFTKPVAHLLGISYALNSGLGNAIPGIGAAGVKPLDVSRVADAVVEAVADDKVTGCIEVHGIEALADQRWRSEML